MHSKRNLQTFVIKSFLFHFAGSEQCCCIHAHVRRKGGVRTSLPPLRSLNACFQPNSPPKTAKNYHLTPSMKVNLTPPPRFFFLRCCSCGGRMSEVIKTGVLMYLVFPNSFAAGRDSMYNYRIVCQEMRTRKLLTGNCVHLYIHWSKFVRM